MLFVYSFVPAVQARLASGEFVCEKAKRSGDFYDMVFRSQKASELISARMSAPYRVQLQGKDKEAVGEAWDFPDVVGCPLLNAAASGVSSAFGRHRFTFAEALLEVPGAKGPERLYLRGVESFEDEEA